MHRWTVAVVFLCVVGGAEVASAQSSALACDSLTSKMSFFGMVVFCSFLTTLPASAQDNTDRTVELL